MSFYTLFNKRSLGVSNFLFPVVFVFLSTNLFSQQYTLSGMVVSENGNPMELVHVNLLQNDSVFVEQTNSDSLGAFSFSVDSGAYTLVCKYLGVEIAIQTVLVEQNTHLEPITAGTSKELDNITVSASKPLIERKIDRLVFNVEQSVRATGGTAFDALMATPMVIVRNDKITMVGKGKVSITINDQLFPYPHEDIISVLKSISSDELNRIEVITMPPAKYDAEGNSGVVNFVLKTNAQTGLFGTLSSSWTQATKSLLRPKATLRYKNEKWTFSGDLSYTYGQDFHFENHTIFYPNRLWNETSERRYTYSTLNGTGAIDYQLNPRTVLGAKYSIRNEKPDTFQISGAANIYAKNGALDSSVSSSMLTDSDIRTHTANAYTIINLDEVFQGKQLEMNVDYLKKDDRDKGSIVNRSYWANGQLKPNSRYVAHTNNAQSYDILTAKIDLKLPTKFFYADAGIKSSFIETNTDFVFYDHSSGISILDHTKTNRFRYSEQIHAAYGSIDMWLSESWEIKVGLRGESTHTIGNSQSTNSITKRSYFKLFPTAYINYLFSEQKMINFGYSKRIDRPAYSSLNPFRYYTASYIYEKGNPMLQPYYTDAIELGFMYKESYTQLFVNSIKNGSDIVSFVNPTTNEQRLTYMNVYDQTLYGLYQMYSFSVFNSRLQNNSSLVVFYVDSRSKDYVITPNIDGWSVQFSTSFAYSFGNDSRLSAEVEFNYYTPSTYGSYKLSEWYEVNAGIRAKLLKDKSLTLALNGTDMFKTTTTTYRQTVHDIQTRQTSVRRHAGIISFVELYFW